ncbi:hypothetical protein [Clostridium sp. MD294]|uniref:hypothetical protein n=1 Tax=Clostridium sp. MD294 TaxID=97138 RepID=UPI0002CB4F79|nr:hypothetical protein [Clostridium sp. MD294]NDO47690.1 hypothetical protein [Clostridium sp. MD294]USF29993.1 hypothetical protein C820_001416 [Clostridium sp. MD294]
MTIAKEKIYAFFITIFVVALINGVLEYYTTKNYYTIPYSKIASDVQKNIDENIVEIKDKQITKGSVMLLAKMKNNTTKLYHFERGYFTLRYHCNVFENVDDRIILIRNRFEEFECEIDKYGKIAINPATFRGSMSLTDLLNKWCIPFLAIVKIVISIIERRKQNLLE